MATGCQKPVITILFSQSTILYSLRNVKVCIGGKKEVYRLLRPRMREHFRYASRAQPSRTGARNVKDGPFSCVLSPRVILRSSACTFCHTGMFCRRVIKRTEKFIPCTVCHSFPAAL